MDARKILIVDDESSLRKVLGDLLRLRGYSPDPVATGTEAVAAARAGTYDAAIVDIGLGEEEMNGLDVIKEIKSCSPHTQCIVLTGMPSKELSDEADRLGAYAYLRKPFDVAELLQTVAKALEAGGQGAAGATASTAKTARPRSTAENKLSDYLRGELRSPLGNVIGLAQNIVESDSAEDAKAFSRILQTEAQGILDNLDAFLAKLDSE